MWAASQYIPRAYDSYLKVNFLTEELSKYRILLIVAAMFVASLMVAPVSGFVFIIHWHSKQLAESLNHK